MSFCRNCILRLLGNTKLWLLTSSLPVRAFVRVLNNEWAKGIAENMLSDVVND